MLLARVPRPRSMGGVQLWISRGQWSLGGCRVVLLGGPPPPRPMMTTTAAAMPQQARVSFFSPPPLLLFRRGEGSSVVTNITGSSMLRSRASVNSFNVAPFGARRSSHGGRGGGTTEQQQQRAAWPRQRWPAVVAVGGGLLLASATAAAMAKPKGRAELSALVKHHCDRAVRFARSACTVRPRLSLVGSHPHTPTPPPQQQQQQQQCHNGPWWAYHGTRLPPVSPPPHRSSQP